MKYNALGGRDVLIIVPHLSLPHPEAVARRPGQLTEEDKLKLQSQELPPNCHKELDIIKAKYEMALGCKTVEVKSGHLLSRVNVLESILHLLNTTWNDGGKDSLVPRPILSFSMLHAGFSECNIEKLGMGLGTRLGKDTSD